MEKEKIIRVQIAHEIPERGWFYSAVDLPATQDELEDAFQRARFTGTENGLVEFEISGCTVWPQLIYFRVNTTSLDELNYLAKRMSDMNSRERIVFRAVVRGLVEEAEDNLLSVKDLINSTYGLEDVIVAENIGDDEQLGRLVIEEEMNEEVNAVPKHLRYLLDEKKIGAIQRKADGGVYVENLYVAAGGYERPEVYDGKTRPEYWEAEKSSFVFELVLCLMPNQQQEALVKRISLPAEESEIRSLMCSLKNGTQEGIECIQLVSSVPQITKRHFSDINEISLWNRLANKIQAASQQERVLFKAVLSAENPKDIIGIWDIMMNLYQYELLCDAEGIDDFFHQYMEHYLDDPVDRRWVKAIMASTQGSNLLVRLGAANTDYGVVSGRGRSLFEPVRYLDDDEVKEKLREESMQDNESKQEILSGMTQMM